MQSSTTTVSKKPTSRLSDIAQRVSGFQSTLTSELQQRRSDDDGRIQTLRDAITHLDRLVQGESRRRQENVESLRAKVDGAISQFKDRIINDITKLEASMNDTLRGLEERVAGVEQRLDQQTQAHLDAVNQAQTTATSGINALRISIQQEADDRRRQNEEFAKRIAHDTEALGARVAEETRIRETAIASAEEEAKQRAYDLAQRVNDRLEESSKNLESVRTQLMDEVAERESAEERIVSTLDEVVTRLQAGLTLVSKQ